MDSICWNFQISLIHKSDPSNNSPSIHILTHSNLKQFMVSRSISPSQHELPTILWDIEYFIFCFPFSHGDSCVNWINNQFLVFFYQTLDDESLYLEQCFNDWVSSRKSAMPRWFPQQRISKGFEVRWTIDRSDPGRWLPTISIYWFI